MALQFSVESLDNIPENQRELYSATENGFQLSIEGYQDPTKLKSALNSERDSAKRLGKANEDWNKLGKTHDEMAALIAQSEQMADDKAASAGEWDKLRDQLTAKHGIAKSEWAAEKDGFISQIDTFIVQAPLTKALLENIGDPLLSDILSKQLRVVDTETGERVARVVNERGEPRINGSGEYMTISELVSEAKATERFGRFFGSTAKSGSGAEPGGRSQSNGAVKSFADAKSMEEKTAAIRAKLKTQSR
jgi:hypothetical protein